MKYIALCTIMLVLPARVWAVDYFVNDVSTAGDVYCSAAGSGANNGLTASTPLDSIKTVVDTYVLTGGDTIYVDTGFYSITAETVLGSADRGSAGNFVTIQGSTNQVAGGTVLDGGGGGNIFKFYPVNWTPAEYFRLRNMTLQKAAAAITADHQAGSDHMSINNLFEELTFRSNTVAVSFSFYDSSSGDVFRRCLFYDNSAGQVQWGTAANAGYPVLLENCVFYQTTGTGISGATITINSIFYASGSGVKLFTDEVVQRGDYNLFFVTNGAALGTLYPKLSVRTASTGADKHSLAAEDPLFVQPAGVGDFHLQSAAGHWRTNGWVTDAATSPAIDLGDPTAAYASEPSPNGSRLNLGVNGGTEQASKSTSDKGLQVLTFNDGGAGGGAIDLYWAQRNLTVTDTVIIECSLDNGGSWITLTNNISATNGVCRWDTTAQGDAAFTRWRVGDVAEGISSTTRNSFAVKNTGVYYVNDASTNGDIYCTAVGAPENNGLFPEFPASSLAQILSGYDLKGGDIVYVDTGIYNLISDISIFPGDSGSSISNMVTIQGSTNLVAGGTVLDRGGGFAVLNFFEDGSGENVIQYMRFCDLTLQNAQRAISLDHQDGAGGDYRILNNRFERIEFFRNTYGVWCDDNWTPGLGTVFDHCNFAKNFSLSLYWNAPSFPMTLTHCSFYQTNGMAIQGGPCVVSNSILYAAGAGGAIYSDTSISGDYNDLYTSDGAIIQSSVGNNYSAWTNATRDAHGLNVDPLFANPMGCDLHLKGHGGRWTTNGWVRDAVSSPCLDAGDPGLPYYNETAPNGKRIDMGSYGNTIYASRASGYLGMVIVIR